MALCYNVLYVVFVCVGGFFVVVFCLLVWFFFCFVFVYLFFAIHESVKFLNILGGLAIWPKSFHLLLSRFLKPTLAPVIL